MAKERLLVIGADPNWLARWRQESEVEIAGIVDLYREGPVVADVPVFDRLDAALAACEPDIATMVTPPDRKTDIDAIYALVDRGLDVLLQKLRPAAPDDGEKLLALAEKSGRSLVIGEAYRYDEAVDTLKFILDSGLVGTVGEIRWGCRRPQGRSPWKDAYAHVMLEDLTYHHMGALQRLVGLQTEQVIAWSEEPVWSIHPHTSVDLFMKLEGGIRVNYSASWTAAGAHTPWLGHIVIDGTEGTVTSDRDGIRFYRRGEQLEPEPETIEWPEPALTGHTDIVGEFLASRQAGRPSATDIRSFVQVTRVLRQALASAAEQRERGKADSLG